MFPKWPAWLRSGAPRQGAVSPADPELTALALGLRKLIKRECVDEADAAIAQTWLAEAGLELTRIDSPAPDGQIVILAAGEERVLADGRDLEMAARRRSAGAETALGELLGYPNCCVDRFVSLEVQDDDALLAALLPREPLAAPAETLWLVGPLSLVSHAPCSLDCEATRLLGRRLLSALGRAHPGFEPAWRELAARVHVMMKDGTAYSLRVRDQRIAEAVHWSVPERGEAPNCDAPALEGRPFDAAAYAFLADHTAQER